MTLTHEQFKVMAALVDVTGVARKAGMSPGVYLKHMADMEVKAERERADTTDAADAAVPNVDRSRQGRFHFA